MRIRIHAAAAVLCLSGCAYSVVVNTLPQGAAVLVDGVEQGRTPCEIRAARDSKILLRKPGFLDTPMSLHDSPVNPWEFFFLGPLAEGVDRTYMTPLWPVPAEERPEGRPEKKLY